MRQSVTARGSGRDWMDREREFEAELHPHQVHVEVDPLVRLMDDRRQVLDQRLISIASAGRTPRVCLYLIAADGSDPGRSRNTARDYAHRQAWQTSTLQVFTDRPSATDPLLRQGWSQVRQQIRSGFVDGVVALTHSAISPHLDEYELQLSLIAHHGGFVALVTPETGGMGR